MSAAQTDGFGTIFRIGATPDHPNGGAYSGGGGSSTTPAVDTFTPMNGQTDFVLSQLPAEGAVGIEMVLDSLVAPQDAWLFVAPQTVRWLNTPSALVSTDTVQLRYRY